MKDNKSKNVGGREQGRNWSTPKRQVKNRQEIDRLCEQEWKNRTKGRKKRDKKIMIEIGT